VCATRSEIRRPLILLLMASRGRRPPYSRRSLQAAWRVSGRSATDARRASGLPISKVGYRFLRIAKRASVGKPCPAVTAAASSPAFYSRCTNASLVEVFEVPKGSQQASTVDNGERGSQRQNMKVQLNPFFLGQIRGPYTEMRQQRYGVLQRGASVRAKFSLLSPFFEHFAIHRSNLLDSKLAVGQS